MFRFIPIGLIGLCVAGCVGGESVDLVAVSGKVFDGPDPVVGALVSFQPSEGRESFAKTRDDGSFVMMYKVGTAGVVPGRHRVVIETPDPNAPEPTAVDTDTDVVSVMPMQGRTRNSSTGRMSTGPSIYEVPEEIEIQAGLKLDPLMYDLNNLAGS